MKALLVLALLTSVAYGEAAETRPAAPVCTVVAPKGTPVFEARYLGTSKQVVTKLYATGTFTRVVITGQTAKTDKTSCIDKGRLATARKALDRAKWKTTQSQATCTGVSEATDIFVGGKKRFTAKLCSPLVLDENSSTALDLIGSYVGPFGLDMVDDIQAN